MEKSFNLMNEKKALLFTTEVLFDFGMTMCCGCLCEKKNSTGQNRQNSKDTKSYCSSFNKVFHNKKIQRPE
jgi:hypothetical protein